METKNIGLYWAIGIGTVLLLVGGWFAYWSLALKGADNRYEVNTKTQQYQAGIVAAQRARVSAWDNAVDEAQKKNIAQTFCTMELDLTQVPADLAAAYERIC
jgi:hypothetical protein